MKIFEEFTFLKYDVDRKQRKVLVLVLSDKDALCGSRKYPYPHHGGNWKFQRGGGVNGPGNSRGEEG